jgi:hypothetical protein
MSGHALPPFLADFMKMRQGLTKNDALPSEKKNVLRGVTKAANLDDVTVKMIIETKPSDKVVAEYFQKLVDKLSAEQMK